jgi:biotin carboxyl carrier protein
MVGRGMSPTTPDGGFDAMPSPAAVQITLDGDPAIVIVVDPAMVGAGSFRGAGLEPPAPRGERGLEPPAPSGEPGLPAPTDPATAATDPAADHPAPGLEDAPDASPVPDGAVGASAGRPLVRAMPPSRNQPPGTERLEIVVDGWRFEAVVEPARRSVLRDLARRERGAGGEGPQVVQAPLPGRIVRVWVRAGDAVEAGAPLCSLEAMKMENEIRAARAGTIERVSVTAGAHVEHGDELVVIA